MAIRTTLLDVGGTFIKCADGRSISVNSNGSREEIASSLRLAVGEADAVAAAVPGPFDYEHGVFLMKHKFSAVYGERFADLCGKPDTPMRFIHDVNCMLLGETAEGNGRGYSRVALVTLGTGLGFSMSIEGRILKSPAGSPLVSIYSLPYRDGVLEDYASKRGFLRAYGCSDITVKEIAGRALNGDCQARKTFDDVGRLIAGAIAPILEEYAIEALLFGGQISRSFALMAESVECGLKNISSLKFVGPVSDIDNATFKGLKHLADDIIAKR